ncbi:MAG: hypothetical protein QMD36_05915, partial [Candidatus Aenigmarchaeota archaeon]|nr:hypothetical protein [Candidatus Aenigmarchaeota archaeon]
PDVKAKRREYRQRPDVKAKRREVISIISKLTKKESLTETELKHIQPYLPIISCLHNTVYGKKFKQIRSQVSEKDLRKKLMELRKFDLIEYDEKRYVLTDVGKILSKTISSNYLLDESYSYRIEKL